MVRDALNLILILHTDHEQNCSTSTVRVVGSSEIALSDPYFIERKFYPNVDFYSGILLCAMGIPTNMFTVMFAIGHLPGWIAHWWEQQSIPGNRIARPRQVYTDLRESPYVPIDQRCDPARRAAGLVPARSCKPKLGFLLSSPSSTSKRAEARQVLAQPDWGLSGGRQAICKAGRHQWPWEAAPLADYTAVC